MFNDASFSLNPVHFFSLSSDCFPLPNNEQIPTISRHLLPSTQELTGEEAFAKVAIGWSNEGIGVLIQSNIKAEASFYPKVEEGDSVELFLDTRDMKSAGFNTRFCHHFFFLAQAVDGISKGERTHFRTEDSHPLCDAETLICQTDSKRNGYVMKIFIPTSCLYGYDPKQFDRLGFSYRINRYGGDSQHFSVVSQAYQIEQQPSLWSTVYLKK